MYKLKYYFYPHKKLITMKINLLAILLQFTILSGFAQTATNFTAKDCEGNMHDLYTELDSGKVVVLNWVMPCGACVPASLTTFNVVQSYQETNPNKVLYYLVDDLANTSCPSLLSWAKSNHITPLAYFSDSSINMLDYGTQSMPKMAVIGGGSHHVFLVADAVIEPAELQDAINAALITASVPENENEAAWVKVFPNPASDHIVITINTERQAPVKAELYNMQGLNMGLLYSGIPSKGIIQYKVDQSKYRPGLYFIRVTDAERRATIKLTLTN
jgi:hypothetical protein